MLQSFYMATSSPSRSPLSTPLKALSATVLAVVIFITGYALGEQPGSSLTSSDSPAKVTGTHGQVPGWVDDEADFEMFWDVWDLVQAQYVDQPVSDKDLYYGALQGLVWGLKDPYSTFFTPEMAQSFNEQLSGKFFGIGAEIGLDDNAAIIVIAPLADTPADRAGIQAGDHIVAIDGTETAGMDVNEAVNHIRGDKGTTVKLMILRDNDDPFEVAIIRDEIRTDSVKWTLRDDGIAVITVSVFNDDTVPLFAKAVKDMQDQGITDLIVDLRNDPGGLLDAAIQLGGYWVGDDVVVVESMGDDRTDIRGEGLPILADTNTVVLVNGGSASASEILAGALQDYDQAEIIGETTFGKGSVQEYHDLPDGSAVKVTVAKWLTPLGRSIDKEGITPDQVVAPSSEDSHDDSDPQLEAAVDFLATQ